MLIANSNFLVPNWTFVVELVIFLAVLAVLAKYVLPYINQAMEARQAAIERNILDAEETRKRAHELEEQQHRALEEARHEARALKDEAAKVGDQLRQELQKKGEEEYQRLVARGSADIEASARKAAEQLRAHLAGLVVTVVEKVLSEGMTLPDQQRLVDDAITEIEAGQAAGQLGAPAGVAGPSTGN